MSATSLALASKLQPSHPNQDKPITLTTNIAKVNIDFSKFTIYQYDIAFKEEVRSAVTREQIVQCASILRPELTHKLFYDGGKIIYSFESFNTFSFKILDPRFDGDDDAIPELVTDAAPTQAPAPAPTKDAKDASKDGKDASKADRGMVVITIKPTATLPLGVIGTYYASAAKGTGVNLVLSQTLTALDVVMRCMIAYNSTDSKKVGVDAKMKALSISDKGGAKLNHHHTLPFMIHRGTVYRTDFASKTTIQPSMLSGNILAVKGAFQSLRLLQDGLCVNIDHCYLPMLPTIPLKEFMEKQLLSGGGGGGRGGGRYAVSSLEQCTSAWLSVIKGIKVVTTHAVTTKYSIIAVGDKPCDKDMITTKDGKNISVAQYFKQTYNITVNGKYPCIITNKKHHIPLEILKIMPNQRYSKDLDTTQRTELLNLVCVRPEERIADALTLLKQLKQSFGGIPVNSKNDKLDISADFTKVQAYTLPARRVTFGANGAAKVNNGTWNIGPQNKYSKIVAHIQSPVLIITEGARMRDDVVAKGMDMMTEIAKSHGLTINKINTRVIVKTPDDASKYLMQFAAAAKPASKPDFVFAICTASDPIYNTIKRVCELHVGIPSQCFDASKFSKQFSGGNAKPEGYFNNILLKVNAKLGGVNFTADLPALLRIPTLVLGADVFHSGIIGVGGGDDATTLSHSAIVGSLDAEATQYSGMCLQQGAKEEVIPQRNMANAVLTRLKAFVDHSKVWPQQIIMFRDGVSEGQFKAALDQEVQAIKMVIDRMNTGIYPAAKGKYAPKIMYLTAVKRHHVRSAPATLAGIDKTGNVPYGTVIDSSIIRPDLSEYYMYLHPGLKGTSRPCLFQLIYNEVTSNLRDVQELCFYLAHLHQRSSRSVSLPVPVYYAHLMAYRTRLYDERYNYKGKVADHGKAWPNQLAEVLTKKPFYL